MTSTVYVHRLVCEAFHGPALAGEECRHLDNCRSNNRPENLAWATKAENEADKIKFGTIVRGEASPNSVLTEQIVTEARRRAAAGERMDLIAAHYDVNPKVMADAITGRRWGWLGEAVPVYTTRRRFSDADILDIRRAAASRTQASIAKSYGVARTAIGQIVRGESYGHVYEVPAVTPEPAQRNTK